MGKKTKKKKAAKTTPRMPLAARPGTAKPVSTVKAAQKVLDEGGKARLKTTQAAVLRAACAKQRTDDVWKNFVTIVVEKASKIDVIKVAIELGISKDKISFQSPDPDLVKEARNYIGDRARCKTSDAEKLKIAAETLGADAIAKPLVSSAEALEAVLAELPPAVPHDAGAAAPAAKRPRRGAAPLPGAFVGAGADSVAQRGLVDVRVSTAAELEKVLAIKTRDPRVGSVDALNLSTAAEVEKVLKIKDRDSRVGRIEALVSSAAELEKVRAIKARDKRVGRVTMCAFKAAEATKAVALPGEHRVVGRVTNAAEANKMVALDGVARVTADKVSSAAEAERLVEIDGVARVGAQLSTAAEAAATAALDGVDRTTVRTADVSEAQQAAAMESVARSVVQSIRRDVVEAAEAAGLKVYAPDADKMRAAGKARRAAYREVLRDASVRGIRDRRSGFARMQACWRQIRRLRGVLRRFFDDRAADEARKPWVCEVGVGAVDRVVPLPDKLLPLHDETTSWLNRIESVLRLRTGARFSKKMLERLITEDAMFIHCGAADGDFPYNYVITDQIEEHLQNFARGEIPLVPWVTSANGDGAYGSAAASGRPTCAFLVFIDVERAAAVLRAELLVVPRVSLSCGAAGVADFDNTLSLLCPGSVPRVLAALERVCALADGAERDDGELVCMLERAGRGRLASRKVFWASFLTEDNVWVRVYGLVGEAGKGETAFARALDFGPYGAAAAAYSHRLACKPKTDPPPSRLDKKYGDVRRVPCGGVARLIARADDVDDRELIEEIAEDDADALEVERDEELAAAAADEPAAAPVSAGPPAPAAAPPSATAPAPAAAESLVARVYTQPPMTPAATRRRVSTGYTDEARRVAGELRLEDDMINTDLVRRIAMVHHAFPNEDETREPLADAVRGLVFDDESKDDDGDDMETT